MVAVKDGYKSVQLIYILDSSIKVLGQILALNKQLFVTSKDFHNFKI